MEVLCTGLPAQSFQHSNSSSSIASQFFLEQQKTLVRAPRRSNGRDVVDVVEARSVDDPRLGADESRRRRWRLPRSHRARKGRGQPRKHNLLKILLPCFEENLSRRTHSLAKHLFFLLLFCLRVNNVAKLVSTLPCGNALLLVE